VSAAATTEASGGLRPLRADDVTHARDGGGDDDDDDDDDGSSSLEDDDEDDDDEGGGGGGGGAGGVAGGDGQQYTMLRTPAAQYFEPELFERLCTELTTFGRRQLGCDAITPPWLALYTDGCSQVRHAMEFTGMCNVQYGMWNVECGME